MVSAPSCELKTCTLATWQPRVAILLLVVGVTPKGNRDVGKFAADPNGRRVANPKAYRSNALTAVELAARKQLRLGCRASTSRGTPLQTEPLDATCTMETLKTTLMPVLRVLKSEVTSRERERRIFEARRLADDPITLEDLAAEFGVSRERVRQIEVRAFEKVQKSVKNGVGVMETPAPLPAH